MRQWLSILTRMSETRAEFLRRLRSRRGLSQDGLANAARTSRSTVVSIERNDERSIYPRNAWQLFEALDQRIPLSEADRAAFSKHFGIELAHAEPSNISTIEITDTPHAPMQTLVDLVGTEVADALLNTLVMVVRAVHASVPRQHADVGSSTLRVIEPPVQRPGYTEQVIREFERVKPASPPAAHTKGKHKRG